MLDGTIVTLSIVEMLLTWLVAGGGFNLSFLRILRMLRVLRVLRLVKGSPGLQRLFRTLLFSLPSLFNVGGLLALAFFIYAVLGMNLFGGAPYRTACGEGDATSGPVQF